MFAATYDELQQKFTEVFGQFFPGGRAELQLIEEPPLENGEPSGNQEPGIEIVAQPPGKRLKSITMLSGGEKTLTAMALLFASFLIRPTPFCLLDEIDAPLDEENIGRFTAVLKDLAQNAQFLVITYNKRTMSIADSLFGVTMEEPGGVSKLVSVTASGHWRSSACSKPLAACESRSGHFAKIDATRSSSRCMRSWMSDRWLSFMQLESGSTRTRKGATVSNDRIVILDACLHFRER
ncbi:MAG: hypothetical protein U0236_14295 [Nitrospira sp.]